jgi:hypothetical protein
VLTPLPSPPSTDQSAYPSGDSDADEDATRLVLPDEVTRFVAPPAHTPTVSAPGADDVTRFEPAADIHAAGQVALRHHLSLQPPILIDARLKPGFPDELFADAETAATVSRRWKEYFPGGKVEMGDSGLGHLDPG